MTLLARLLRPRADAITTPEQLRQLLLHGGGWLTESGAVMNPEQAMQISAVYACIRVVSEDVASLPLLVYRRDGRNRTRATDHWAYRLLHDQPNPWQTSLEFREGMQAHLERTGMAFALKTVLPRTGEVAELLPVSPERVQVKQYADYRVTFIITLPDGTQRELPRDRMLYLRGLSLDGVTGVSPIRHQAEALGVARQLLRHAGSVFRHGAQVAGVLKHPGILGEEGMKRLRAEWDEVYAGAGNAAKMAILEEGMDFTRVGITGEEAQYLETRKLTRSEIAGIYRVPASLINDRERATFSNGEQEAISYVVYGLRPRLARWEQRLLLDVIPERERDTLYVEFLVDGLLRGDSAARSAFYQSAVMTGWLTRNEVRERENLNPAPGLDVFLTPQNITGKPPGGGNPKQPAPPPAAPDDDDEEAA